MTSERQISPEMDEPHQRRILWLASLAVTVSSMSMGASVEFGRDVQPLLSDRCFACHGPDAAQRQAGLRLDLREAAVAPGMSGRVPITPGDSAASELIQRVASEDPARRMPPAYAGHAPLEAEEVEILRLWIEGGAEYSTHWAFVPPERKALPEVSQSNWLRQPLDSFVLARLDDEGLTPSPEAAPSAWLRRMMFDLTGLPPSMERVRAFTHEVERDGEAAYAQAVDQALSSPRYGERMTMDWLDVARYADTHGFNNDSERSMWRWRDWVIEAFNRNLPYDRFITEQLAGDLLPSPTIDQLIATGFNRNHVINSEGGIIEEEYRVEYVADRVRTLGMAWLGLTVECARCHDHKFDPISQADYYKLFAFFDNVPELGEAGRVANAVPMIPAPTAGQRSRITSLRSLIEELERADEAKAIRFEPSADALSALTAPEYPRNADFFVGCEDGPQPGIAGQACGAREIDPESEIKLEKHGAFTLGLWFRADAEHSDAPLFSAIDYSADPASSEYGQGIGLRSTGGEVELRLSKRYPSYSITVRSSGAGLRPKQWHHVAAVYEGSEGKRSMRAEAAWVRLFVDGREVGTKVLHDDAQSAAKFVKPYRLGRDNHPAGSEFPGTVDEVAVWRQALADAEIRQVFEAAALPWSVARAGPGLERRWLHRKLNPATELAELRGQLFALERVLPTTMVMQDMDSGRQTHLLMRGRYDSPGDPVDPAVPEVLLGKWPEKAPKNRFGLAKWLTSGRHPTTARVVVNRFWQQIFGLGLVKTSGDLGLQGETPSHPELLDWLAVEFAASGWDVKRLMRSIVLSAAYRQDSAVDESLRKRDPENRLLARGPRFRLPAESIRDQALELAGMLSGQLGGASVRPYQPEGLYDGVVVGADYPGTKWEQDDGESLYRRSLYTFWKRTLPHPTMTVFDAPDREFCTVQRSITNTPLQALTLMNDPTFVEASRKLAERVLREAGPDQSERLAHLFELVMSRGPTEEEQRVLEATLGRILQSFSAEDTNPSSLLAVGASPSAADLAVRELAAYAMVASMVLSTDEAITKS